MGTLVAAILHANNIRDIDLDRRAGKVTLATLLGRQGANVEYFLLVAAAYVVTVVLVTLDPSLWPVLLVAVSLPVATALVRAVFAATEPQTLNRILRKTAGLHARFGALLTLGLLVRAILDRL